MGLLGRLGVGKAAGEAAGATLEGALSGAGNLARDLRTAITGEVDPALRAELDAKLMEIEGNLMIAQTEINKVEAQSPNWFVAGWRPSIGWVGAIALFYNFIARPILTIWFPPVEFNEELVAQLPEIDSSALWPIIAGMLGLGVARTVEKQGGIQDRH